MRKKVRQTVDRFIKELKAQHPGVTVELLDHQSLWVDASVRILCTSSEQIDDVMETEAHLTTGYYLDEGVYITASAEYTGPPDQKGAEPV